MRCEWEGVSDRGTSGAMQRRRLRDQHQSGSQDEDSASSASYLVGRKSTLTLTFAVQTSLDFLADSPTRGRGRGVPTDGPFRRECEQAGISRAMRRCLFISRRYCKSPCEGRKRYW